MSRLSTLSTAAKLAIFSQQTDKVFLPLIKISGTGIATPIRLVRDINDIVSTVEGSSNTYTHFPFNVHLPADINDGAVKTVQLSVDAVDQTLIAALRSLTVAPAVTLWVVIADSPNTLEIGPLSFVVGNVAYDAQQVNMTLKYEERLGNKLEGLTFDPINFPGVH